MSCQYGASNGAPEDNPLCVHIYSLFNSLNSLAPACHVVDDEISEESTSDFWLFLKIPAACFSIIFCSHSHRSLDYRLAAFPGYTLNVLQGPFNIV